MKYKLAAKDLETTIVATWGGEKIDLGQVITLLNLLQENKQLNEEMNVVLRQKNEELGNVIGRFAKEMTAKIVDLQIDAARCY